MFLDGADDWPLPLVAGDALQLEPAAAPLVGWGGSERRRPSSS